MLRKSTATKVGVARAFSTTLVILGLAFAALGQPSPPADREALVKQVEERAARDVDLGRPPQGIGELKTLFGDDADALGIKPAELLEIYEDGYKKAQEAIPWWESLWKQGGSKPAWWVAAILLLLLVFRDVLKDSLTKLLTALRDFVYAKLAGSRLFRRAALRHYRKALVAKYETLNIPFRPDRPLEMREVFVPLKVQGSSDIDQVDAQQAIADHRRLMVTGAPGSGKSMLAKHLALSLAEQGLAGSPGQPVPVLLELNRLNDSELSLEEQLVEMFRLNGFPKADGFVRQALEQGFLVLLFDGLDEVVTKKRTAVVAKIKDLLDAYDKCLALITCRTAVYHQEFADAADRTLEIVEFSDHQIWRFLGAWERDMPEGKSIEQLLQTLRDRPRIMALARNPLLLTIIAYLYTDTKFVLPHSRTEFYERSTDLLLEQWKRERNEFKSNQKRLVLQHLALFNQKRGTEQQEDRRSIELKTVLAEVKKVLPQLNLENSDAHPMLDEIVERSGLLLSIDGGARYQFAHLTLQEFFAAAELRTESQELLRYYRADPGAWRETVKLWCGLGSDSTEVVRVIFEIDPVTAFESLADVQKIDPSVADGVVGHFRERLAEGGEAADSIRRAYAAVAADLRPRGQEILEFLVGSLTDTANRGLQEAAADALSRTNLPRAAQVLAENYAEMDQARLALVRMGDLAVRKLVAIAEQRSMDAIDDLRTIGTPQAALALAPFLWSEDQSLAGRTARSLGALLTSEGVKSELRELALTDVQRKATWFDWLWEPFGEPESSALPVIAGRIGHLLFEEPPEARVLDRLEPQLVLALSVASMEAELDSSRVEDVKNRIEQYKLADYESPDAEEVAVALKELVDAIKIEGRLKDLLSALDPSVALDLLVRAVMGPVPTVEDWRNIFRPLKFSFRKSWIFVVIIVSMLALTAAAAVGVYVYSGPTWLKVLSGIGLLWGFLFNLTVCSDDEMMMDEDAAYFFFLGPGGGFVFAWHRTGRGRPFLVGSLFGVMVIGVIFGCWLPVAVYFTLDLFSPFASKYLMVGFWFAFSLVSLGLWFRGLRLQRRAQNILHGIVEPPQVLGDRRGVARMRGLGASLLRRLRTAFFKKGFRWEATT